MVIQTALDVNENLPNDTRENIQTLKQVAAGLEKEMIRPLWDDASISAFGIEPIEDTKFGPDNIVGVGIGEQLAGGRLTGDLCVKVFTEVKAHPDWISTESVMPDIWEGYRVDVDAIGHIEAFGLSLGFEAPEGYLNPRQRFRSPLPGGVSIGQYPLVTAGTLGCLCTSTGPNEQVLVLSNNHVLAATNTAKEGDPIVQPGRYDNGKTPSDIVARLYDFVPIRFEGADNFVDAALAKPEPDVKFTPEIQGIGKVQGVVDAVDINTQVKKMGRTTQLTQGTVKSVGGTFRVSYGPAGKAILKDQIMITGANSNPFSAGGDSGSLVVDQRNRAVGLLFAGTPSHTFANPIANVLSFSETAKRIQGLKIISSIDSESNE